MSRVALTLFVIVGLAGCESTKVFCEDHPVACPVIWGVVSTAVLMCIGPHGGHSQGKTQPLPDVTTQPFTCTTAGNCK